MPAFCNLYKVENVSLSAQTIVYSSCSGTTVYENVSAESIIFACAFDTPNPFPTPTDAIQVTNIGLCDCLCYTLTNNGSSAEIGKFSYLDCDLQVHGQILEKSGDTIQVCSKFIGDASPNIDIITGGTCVNGLCPECICYGINITSGATISYIDCDGNIVDETIPPNSENPIHTFCAINPISSSTPINPLLNKDCLGGTCTGDATCYFFQPIEGLSSVKYYDVNGEIITRIQNLPFNFCSRGVILVSNGLLGSSDTSCTSSYDCNECGCYEFILPPDSRVDYNNCEGVQISSYYTGKPINVCSNGTYNAPDGASITYNGLCVDGVCVENCFCFTIDPNGIDGTLSYMGCDNKSTQIGIIASEGIVKVCGQYIINPDTSWTITQGNLCLDAQYCVGDCECYVFTSKVDGELVEYIDCNNVILTGYTSGGTIDYPAKLKICSKSILNVGRVEEYNLGSCTNSICNTSLCDCYTVAAGSLGGLVYLDCNDTIIGYPDVESQSPISFCAQFILSYPIVEVSKGLPCIYGVCPTTRDILIQKLNSLRGPCPEVCDGSKKIGGVTGTDEINIITQKPL